MKSFAVAGMVEWAVLKEGWDDIAERLDPGVGEGSLGVWYLDGVGESREEVWWASVVGEASGFAVGL